MSSVHPAIRGKLGSTEYYLVALHAEWVTNNLKIPSEMEGWDDETIDEKYQRKINWSRVEKSIAPYLATDPDRFFGSIIVTVLNHESMKWEPADKILKDIPNAYAEVASKLGFLTLSGQEVMVPLDGQHRLAALGCAITGKNHKDEPIAGLTANPAVAKDMINLMLVRHVPALSRKIFNKVNRYARPTSKADNLITSDDDIVAVISRDSNITGIPGRLVNLESNTIPEKSHYVTTLATIYEIVKVVLADERPSNQLLPEAAKQTLLKKLSKDFFGAFLGEDGVLNKAMKKPEADGDDARVRLRSTNLLMKPFAQVAAAAAALDYHQSNGVKLKEACAKLQKLDWRRDNKDWQKVLLNGEKILTGDTARRLASRVIAYQLGVKMEPAQLKTLKSDYSKETGGRSLPKPV